MDRSRTMKMEAAAKIDSDVKDRTTAPIAHGTRARQ
jgi:hypothetical protein